MYNSSKVVLGKIKNSFYFEITVVSIIILSALIIGVESYHYEKSSVIYNVMYYLSFFISLFYAFEIFVRLFSEDNISYFFKNLWNCIDFLIILISLIPVEDSEMVLLGRVVRIFRVLRIIVIIPDLKILLNSIFKSLPQISFVFLLTFLIFYIYAAVGTMLFEKVNEELWGNISITLLTLFRVMTFEDWTDVMYETMSHPEGSVYSWIYYLSFIFLTAFAFLNMIIGIIVNVMEEEREQHYKDTHPFEPSNSDLQKEIMELKKLIESLAVHREVNVSSLIDNCLKNDNKQLVK